MSLPPGVLAQQLVTAFPQFVLCDGGLNQTLAAFLSPMTNQTMSDLVQWLQANPAMAEAAGSTLNPDGAPQTTAAPLDPSLIAAVMPAVSSTSAWIVTQSLFDGIAWTTQMGVPPESEIPQPADGSWTLATESPSGGLTFTSISYSGSASNQFTLSLVNNAPRHLSVYAAFTSGSQPVEPQNWASRLPVGAPAGFESATVKYLGMLIPAAAVGAIPVSDASQTLVFDLPPNADAVGLSFGGLSGNGFSTIPDATGVLMTVVLDMVVPWIVAYSQQQKSDLAAWYGRRLADPALIAGILASGSFLLGVEGSNALLAALSANMTGVLLGAPLAHLRKSIASELAPPPSADYGWVDQLAPAAGWAAQMIGAYLAGGLNAQYWVAAMPAPIALTLSPATTLALDLTLLPDPDSGIWPYAAVSYSAEILYGGGFTQILSGNLPAAPSSAAMSLPFGSVPNRGPIAIVATVKDTCGTIVASVRDRIEPPPNPISRTLAVQLAVRDTVTVVGASTHYACVARLAYSGGNYVWSATAQRSAAVGLPQAGGAPALSALTALTFQGGDLCLGYAWGVSNQSAVVCGGNGPIQNPYYVQNIGTAVPSAQLRDIACGLVVPPDLAYAPYPDEQTGIFPGGLYVDLQGTGVFLRQVVFGAGRFDLEPGKSVGQLPAQSGPLAACLVGQSFVAAVNANQGLLQIVELASAPVSDASAPMALVYCGQGSRIGLLNVPVAVAATPNGAIVVLEQGTARVQAFDIHANALPIFAGEAAFALRSVPEPAYSDMAVSAQGLIYILGSQNNGATATDFFLDVYTSDGALLTTTQGVNAAKIAIGAGQTLYTLDFDALTGPNGRIEPMLSVWRPQA